MPCTKNNHHANAAMAVTGLGLMVMSLPFGSATCNDGRDCGAPLWVGPSLFLSGAALAVTGIARKVYGELVTSVSDQEQGHAPLINTNEQDDRNNKRRCVIS